MKLKKSWNVFWLETAQAVKQIPQLFVKSIFEPVFVSLVAQYYIPKFIVGFSIFPHAFMFQHCPQVIPRAQGCGEKALSSRKFYWQ